ncbi:MAG: uncharacterized protein JWN70_6490, partial [Planctomycetaceae bacterium]|nr:uncharacterized protein [Planctomycetaceae bacterium]
MTEQTPPPIDVDDPGLTAYALGELEGPEVARYAAAVATSAELQAAVAEIQAEARLLTDELSREPQVPIAAERRIEIVVEASKSHPEPAISQKRSPKFARRAAAVAASIALIPGAWYAFQAGFPRMKLNPVVARQELPSAYYFNDDVQYITVNPSSPQSKALDAYKDKLSRPGPMVDGPGPGVMSVRIRNEELDGESKSEPASTPFGTVALKQSGKGISLGDQVADAPDSSRYTAPLDSAAPAAEPAQGLQREPDQSKMLGEIRRRGFMKNQDPKGAQAATKLPAPSMGLPRGSKGEPRAVQLLTDQSERNESITKSNRPAGPKSDSKGARAAVEETPRSAPADVTPGLLAGSAPTPTKSYRVLREDKLALAPSKPTRVEFEDAEAVTRVLVPLDPFTGEAYKPIFENAFITPKEQQLSTFSIDVDTASYANLRRFLQGGQLPPPDAVRIEELVNYFAYQYPQPQDGRPFSVQTDIAACPWKPGHQLVRIGLKGKEIPKEQRTATNLVFLVDVSGSMQAQNKLPLVRESLTTLVNQLDERDKVAIVTYAGEAGLRLPSTSVAKREVVLAAIASLGAGGSTNGAAGINTAYDIAAQEFIEKGTNRVI